MKTKQANRFPDMTGPERAAEESLQDKIDDKIDFGEPTNAGVDLGKESDVKPEPEPQINIKTIKRELPCLLTKDEKIGVGKEMGAKYEELSVLERQKKSSAAHYKAEIEKVNDEISDMAKLLREGQEYRMVECEEHINFDRDIVDIYRTDTGEHLGTRGIKPSERQMQAFPEDEQADTEGSDAPGKAMAHLSMPPPAVIIAGRHYEVNYDGDDPIPQDENI